MRDDQVAAAINRNGGASTVPRGQQRGGARAVQSTTVAADAVMAAACGGAVGRGRVRSSSRGQRRRRFHRDRWTVGAIETPCLFLIG